MNRTTSALAALLALNACGPSPARPPATPAPPAASATSAPAPAAAPTPSTGAQLAATLTREQVPPALRACWGCHEGIVRTYYVDHAMARAAAPMGSEPVPAGNLKGASGVEYAISTDAQSGAILEARYPDGGRRRQRLVGRIGAGRFDVSWAAADLDPQTGAALDRLYFAPVELVTGHGWALSPFEVNPPAEGLDFALTGDCLGCHVARNVAELPSAQVAGKEEPGGPVLYPPNHLGADAFEHLQGLRCEVCHGDTRAHREAMAGLEEAPAGELQIASFDSMPTLAQRDLCGRCHLQGDMRLALGSGPGDRTRPLAAHRPTFVPEKAGDDFRFVGQLERLALSSCFIESSAMTCNTCHEPHRGVVAQGIPSFDERCASCHGPTAQGAIAKGCSRPSDLTVESVTGEAARAQAGCVDCHVRRSQPFDLPHVRAADHWIRRRIPRPRMDVPHRDVAESGGALRLFDRERLRPAIDTPAGKLWESGLRAITLVNLGRADEALALFDRFPAPGTPAATRAPNPPPPLEPLQSQALFHENRALALLGAGRVDEALAAFDDALTLDPRSPTTRMGRARLRLLKSDIEGLLLDTQAVIDAYPMAEEPWELRLVLAEKFGRPDLAYEALSQAVLARPSSASHWFKLGKLEEQRGNLAAARHALERARALQPSVFQRLAAGQPPR